MPFIQEDPVGDTSPQSAHHRVEGESPVVLEVAVCPALQCSRWIHLKTPEDILVF